MRLIVLLMVLERASMASASPAGFSIENFISINPTPPLLVSCSHYVSSTEVIPWQTIQFSKRTGMEFTPNIWGTTNYSCEFKWGDRTQSFIVWYDKFFLAFWKKRPCTHCLWTVTEAGFYREGEEDGYGHPVLVYMWK